MVVGEKWLSCGKHVQFHEKQVPEDVTSLLCFSWMPQNCMLQFNFNPEKETTTTIIITTTTTTTTIITTMTMIIITYE
jgi:hypothetical protein